MWRSITVTVTASVSAVMAEKQLPFLRMKDLPGIKNPESAKWIPVEDQPNTAFLPTDETLRRFLEEDAASTSGQWEGFNPYSVEPFVEGMGDYDEYQQAWRMLGFMIDCNQVSYANYGNNQNDHHSGDENTTGEGCARYILWAAVSAESSCRRKLYSSPADLAVYRNQFSHNLICHYSVCRSGL